jgi:hypothetical protein
MRITAKRSGFQQQPTQARLQVGRC